MTSKKVLLVEDDFLIALHKQRQLGKYNYDVLHLSSGEESVEYALSESCDVDLILMDINMGAMSGTEAAQRILEQKEIPIVFFSSHTEPEIVQKTEHISSYGYVLKDSSIVVLDASIKMALKLFEAKKKIEHSEAYRHKMFESSQFPIVVLESENYTCIDCNAAALRIYELNNKVALIGKTILDFSAAEQYDGVDSTLKLKSILQLAKADGTAFFHWRNQKSNGDLWDTEIHVMSFESEGKILLQYSLFDVTEQWRIEKVKLNTQNRLALQRSAIAQLVSDSEMFESDFQDSLEKICRLMLDALCVSRFSIWQLNEAQTELVCLALMDKEQGNFSAGLTLETATFPLYFQSILAENRIISDDVFNNVQTSELYEYYTSENIHSMMDAGFFVKGKLTGVVCAEHRGEKRAWHPDEESFISTAAAIVGQIFDREKQLQLT